MEEGNKEIEVVPNINSKDWPKSLEMMEYYVRGFQGVYGQPLSYGLRYDLEPLAASSDPTHRANISEYFTYDQEMIVRGLILSGPTVSGSDPKSVVPFTDLFIPEW